MAEPAGKVPVRSGGRAATERRPGSSPWEPFDTLRQEIDRVFADVTRSFFPSYRGFMGMEPFWGRESASMATPAVDIVEKDKEYRITAELPGIDERNLEVTVADDVLTIKGEKHEEMEEKDKGYHVSERRYGSFQRSFQLPPDIDQGKIGASFQKGILTLTLPKAAEAKSKSKKIAIQSK